MRRFVAIETSVSVSLNSTFVTIDRPPGVKNASSGPRRLVAAQTIRFAGETRSTRLLFRSAIRRSRGSGPA